ncbi:MAG TPA: thiamine pyrophosphate-dependent enzyme [Acidobacteriaceae bacterium]|nr:thiamine pyrophosphate-dependent enzyme [Acidobacteriaceae bacterium]
MSPKQVAQENPLIPNARLRQIYRAVLRAHLLGEALPPSQRSLTAAREAALVSTSVDLTSRDLISDSLSGPVIDFLRGAPLHRALTPESRSGPRILADSGSASLLPAPADPDGRIWSALGAAAALKSAAAVAKAADAEASSADSAVVVVTAQPGELPPAAWKSVLAFASRQELPILFVMLPVAPSRRPPKSAPINIRSVAQQTHVPAIPVDAGDPVALYRVAQESVGHARIGGGPALIDCVTFPAVAASPSPSLSHLEDYMLHRNIVTKRWIESERSSFAAKVSHLKSASK